MSTTAITTTGKKGDLRIAFGFERPDRINLRGGDEGLQHAMRSSRAAGFDAPEPCVYIYSLWNQQVMVPIPVVHMHHFDYRQKDLRGNPTALVPCRAIADMVYGQPVKGGAERVLDLLTDWMTDIKNLPPPTMFRNHEQMLSFMEAKGIEVVR